MHPIDRSRISQIKPSFVTRRVDHGDIGWLDDNATGLKSGDLVVACVKEIGQHTRIELPNGRRATLHVGDEVLLACGARYAPDQFEADCPTSAGPAHLAAAGGIAGHVQESHGRMKPATVIEILGAVCSRDGARLNLDQYAVTSQVHPVRVPVVAVCGTAMNAGKTHTAASLVRGMALAGHKVAAFKITGTGAGGDLWSFKDSGAHFIRDFTDAGFATTYRWPVADILAGMRRVIAELETAGAEVIVLELADGLLQGETAALLRHDELRSIMTAMIFAAGDAMGAHAGAAWLRRAGLPVCAVSGCLTRSPLAMREVDAAVGLPCLAPDDLQARETVARLLATPPATKLRTAA